MAANHKTRIELKLKKSANGQWVLPPTHMAQYALVYRRVAIAALGWVAAAIVIPNVDFNPASSAITQNTHDFAAQEKAVQRILHDFSERERKAKLKHAIESLGRERLQEVIDGDVAAQRPGERRKAPTTSLHRQ